MDLAIYLKLLILFYIFVRNWNLMKNLILRCETHCILDRILCCFDNFLMLKSHLRNFVV